jgi:HSP20 family protein
MASLLGWAPMSAIDRTGITAPVQVAYEGDHVVITADLPGVDPKHLDVTYQGGVLTVVGQRGERRYQFAVQLGNDYDSDNIEAALDKGVLTLVAERRAEAKPRKITLKGVEAKRLESGNAQ